MLNQPKTPREAFDAIADGMCKQVAARPLRIVPDHIKAQRADFWRRWHIAAEIEADARRGQKNKP